MESKLEGTEEADVNNAEGQARQPRKRSNSVAVQAWMPRPCSKTPPRGRRDCERQCAQTNAEKQAVKRPCVVRTEHMYNERTAAARMRSVGGRPGGAGKQLASTQKQLMFLARVKGFATSSTSSRKADVATDAELLRRRSHEPTFRPTSPGVCGRKLREVHAIFRLLGTSPRMFDTRRS